MASKRPTMISEYIRAAPREGQQHLRRLYAILKSVAPEAEEAIKWGTPFFLEPRFLFAFSAHKAHLDFAPTAAALKAFRKELEKHKTTKNYLQVPYNESLPENLIRKIAEYCLQMCVNVRPTLSGNSITRYDEQQDRRSRPCLKERSVAGK